MNDRPDLVTRCPFCETTFRVTLEQLDVASGTVRCGACLRIFQAADSIVEGAADGAVDLTVESIEVTDEEFSVEDTFTNDTSTEKTDLLENRNEWFELRQDESDYWSDWEFYVTEHLVPYPGRADSHALEQMLYSDYLETDVGVLEAAEAVEESEESEEPQESGEVEAVGEAAESAEVGDSEVAGDAEKVEGIEETEEVEEAEFEEATLDELVSGLNLQHDPGELVREYVEVKKQHPLWAILALLLLATGLLQYVWFNRDIYAQDEEYRPLYETLCNWVGCQLPDYSNFSVISTTNLVVRPHPEVEDALMVDAIIRNSGIYRQQFPVMKLQFKDIEDSLVAIRYFYPRDYLAGELRGLRLIPANTEVHFSLEIVHPGEQALGYSLEVAEIRW